ncbi:MAG: hypothetical protein QOF45_1826 [Gaiellaceae bacterium]|nr:hypothetical protein [Gaiellaceae bacterium]
MLGAIIGLLVLGLFVGALARFALPGPDPMPLWATIGLGLAGSFLGGLIAAAIGLRSGDTFGLLLAAVAGAAFLLFLYRRFVQKRPLTGPGSR